MVRPPVERIIRGRPDWLGEPVRRLSGARPGQPVPALPTPNRVAGAGRRLGDDRLGHDRLGHDRLAYPAAFESSWLHAELDQATAWLDRSPLSGEIVELAAGTGWWSPLLAQKGQLSMYDINPGPLELARERLVAHHLRAHLHVRDAWAAPDRQVDGLFCGFWLSHVPDARLDGFLELACRWLLPGGRFAFIDSLPDPESGAVDHDPVAADGTSMRRLADGREFRIVKVHRSAEQMGEALRSAGFDDVRIDSTSRFFQMGSGVRAS